ncbi:MFS transporter [Sphingomonas daechungensis]|uniref:MFS transporter n=1 Tax=Sphingomonas daechungensis TaxID=1176646 RepID=A0ABX6T2F3_9SPHN|nr:MFS transporter [Sphingomonas daechungensis]QNP43666.1 MFS transporter [Sphingomonas daechungensis]
MRREKQARHCEHWDHSRVGGRRGGGAIHDGRRRAERDDGALIFLLGAAVFLNYVDRGAIGIASPLMKTDLGLSEEAYGVVFSAFFWIYAPVQMFAGWLCDRFSVYKLMAAGILLWAGSTFLMGFAGGFTSLLVLRIMLGVGESISFPGSSKIIARHVEPERRGVANAAVATGLALGPAVGTLAGGLILQSWGWQAIFFVFGIVTLAWLLPWWQTVKALPTTGFRDEGQRVPLGQLLSKWPLWSMSIVHALGNYCFYFLLAWLPLFLTKSRGFSIGEMTMLATLGYAVQGACALGYGHFSDWWTRSGRSEALCRRWMMVASQTLAALAILGLAYAHDAVTIAILLCLAGRHRHRSRSTFTPSRRCSRDRARRERGSAYRTRSAICPALSGRSSPASWSSAPAITRPSC